MDNNEMISFDEVDLNWMLNALQYQLKNTNWDVTDDVDWCRLSSLKALEEKIMRAI